MLAIAPVEAAVVEVEPLELPVEAKPLVEPVWLKELLELVAGDEEAALWSLLATEPEDDAVVESVLAAVAVLFVWFMALPELELPLSDAVEFCVLLLDGVDEFVSVLFVAPDEFSVDAPLMLEFVFVLFELFRDELVFEVSLVLAEPLMDPEAAPEVEPEALRLLLLLTFEFDEKFEEELGVELAVAL